MPVSVEKTTPRAATLVWEVADDPDGYIVQAVDNGRLEAALTALGLPQYENIAALDSEQRAMLLRQTARLTHELTSRVRNLTVATRDLDGASWATLAGLVAGDPEARSTARSTYQAGLRQMSRPNTDI